MGFVEEMKWWHWMLVSLLVGAAFAYINMDSDAAPDRSIQLEAFEQKLLDPPDKVYGPNIQNIKIYPPVTAKGGMTQVVTFKVLDQSELLKAVKEKKKSADVLVEAAILADVPYGETGSRSKNPNRGETWPGTNIYTAKAGDTLESITRAQYGGDSAFYRQMIIKANQSLSNSGIRSEKDMHFNPGEKFFIPWPPKQMHTIKDFIDDAAKTNKSIKYTFTWWKIPKYGYPAWMGASFIVIGVIWPLLMHLLVTGGLGRSKGEGDEYDLARFKGSKAKAAAAVKPGVTEQDMAQLAALEASLEASLKAGGGVKGGAAPETKTEEPIKPLTAAPVEATKEPEAPAKPRHYTGEFYPVVRGNEKKDDK